MQKRELRARTVTIKVRYGDFTTVTRSHTDEAPTADAAGISQRAVALLGRTEAATRPVRLLGVGTHGLAEGSDAIPLPGSLDYGDNDPIGTNGVLPWPNRIPPSCS